MEKFYEFSRQIDLWEEDLRSELSHLQCSTQEKKNSDKTAKQQKGFCNIYSKSLNEEITICLN